MPDLSKLNGYYIEDLKPGMSDTVAKTLTEADIVIFGGLVGDLNPVHINREYASESMFGERIAHGMLTASFISTVLGMKLPGPGCIYMSQSLTFKRPVKIGDTVNAVVTVKEVNVEKKQCTLTTVVLVNDRPVIEGEALMMVPARGAGEAKDKKSKK